VKADLVSGILPVRSDGRMLLLQRPGTETWEPPAGRLAPGEGFASGAVREVYEETGMLVAPQRLLATWVGERPGGGLLASATYIGRASREDVRISHEHLGYKWVTLDEWLGLPSWWSRENILRVAGPVAVLPQETPPVPPPPGRGPSSSTRTAGSLWRSSSGAASPPWDCGRTRAGCWSPARTSCDAPGARPWRRPAST
jgi:8-oxo-dGTP diphosphatase